MPISLSLVNCVHRSPALICGKFMKAAVRMKLLHPKSFHVLNVSTPEKSWNWTITTVCQTEQQDTINVWLQFNPRFESMSSNSLFETHTSVSLAIFLFIYTYTSFTRLTTAKAEPPATRLRPSPASSLPRNEIPCSFESLFTVQVLNSPWRTNDANTRWRFRRHQFDTRRFEAMRAVWTSVVEFAGS